MCWRMQNFNSHARVGRDSKAVPEVVGSPDFNSHARVGRDNDLAIACRPLMDFNSHARVGRDPAADKRRPYAKISTHTPAWGVTRMAFARTSGVIFQLTRPRGA